MVHARQGSFRLKVNSEVKINRTRAARSRASDTDGRDSTTVHSSRRGAKPRIQFSRNAHTRESISKHRERRPLIFYCRPANMFFHTRRFREPERRYRTESHGDTLRPSCRSSSLGCPRRGDSFARGYLEGQGHFNPPTSEVIFSNRKKRRRRKGRRRFRRGRTRSGRTRQERCLIIQT